MQTIYGSALIYEKSIKVNQYDSNQTAGMMMLSCSIQVHRHPVVMVASRNNGLWLKQMSELDVKGHITLR